ncbi:MAG: lamin tail domain-containing protein [Bacteroidales bacterium]|nr:lamin tail domain-containing protein [Bacteroidales bacterium]
MSKIQVLAKQTKLLFLVMCLLPNLVFSQLNDDFSDGNFSDNPVWTGSINNFQINSSNQLQLLSDEAGISYLSTENKLMSETEWHFWVKLSFSPSGNNNARIYLVSDNSDLTSEINGYFLQLGEAGTSDAIELFRQNGNEFFSVCRGDEALISSSFSIGVKVIRNSLGQWDIYVDYSGGENYVFECSGFDDVFTTTEFFGVYCNYTISNSKKFYFDDFYIGPEIFDIIPPEIISIDIVSAKSIDVKFSESIQKLSSENPNNYFVNNGIGIPKSALLDDLDLSLVHLQFEREFQNRVENILSVSNIEDLSGNKIMESEFAFSLFSAYSFDIVINEIMADPNPIVSLPDFEYLELFNRTSLPVNLNNWILCIGSSEKEISNITIEPKGFLILGDDDAGQYLSVFGNFYGFSSFTLTNSGQTIILKNPEGRIISTVSYSEEWYKNKNKENGGWSLEQIDPNNPCAGISNWIACEDVGGGTPGKENSVFAPNPDLLPPDLYNVNIIDTQKIKLFFTEPMDSASLLNNEKYHIDHEIGNPIGVELFPPDYRSVILFLNNDLQENIIYFLSITDSLTDCVGNAIPVNTSIHFAIPKAADSLDIVINEFLPNPRDNGERFIEIYNRSEKILDLSNLMLASYDLFTSNLATPYAVSEEGFLFFPGEYIVLSESPETIQQQYFTSNPDAFIKMKKIPSFTNTEGVVAITNKAFQIIDMFSYSEDMQFPLLNSTEGVSLERINFDRPTNDKSNWHSAAEGVGFATPAYKNSQYSEIEQTTEQITVSPDIFSPDNDGYNDVLNINYEFNAPGYVANILVYDARGRLIIDLVKNELLGTKGCFSWDGIDRDNAKATIGVYIIYIEIFDLKGNVKYYKKTAVLGGKL